MTHEDRLEMLGVIIDIFEDWLTSKGITAADIPCEDRDQAIKDGDDPDRLAIIYGQDYDILTGSFEDTLIKAGLLERELRNRQMHGQSPDYDGACKNQSDHYRIRQQHRYRIKKGDYL